MARFIQVGSCYINVELVTIVNCIPGGDPGHVAVLTTESDSPLYLNGDEATAFLHWLDEEVRRNGDVVALDPEQAPVPAAAPQSTPDDELIELPF